MGVTQNHNESHASATKKSLANKILRNRHLNLFMQRTVICFLKSKVSYYLFLNSKGLTVSLLKILLKIWQYGHVMLEEGTSERQDTTEKKGTNLIFHAFPWLLSRPAKLPNILFSAASAAPVNSSSRTSLSIRVPRRVFNPPITWPRVAKEHEKENEQYINEHSYSMVESRKASSDESTARKAPSLSTKRHPEMASPDKAPFSSAS